MILKNTSGGTIIEVLIALTVVSSMLGGAYVLANRSLNNNRQSQERGEAIKIVESQIEQLKGAITSGDSDAFTTSNVFCMDDSNNVTNANSPAVSSVPSIDADDLGSYTDSCRIQNQSLPYYTSIQRTAANQFNFYTRWEKLGSGRNEIKFIYRVYQ